MTKPLPVPISTRSRSAVRLRPPPFSTSAWTLPTRRTKTVASAGDLARSAAARLGTMTTRRRDVATISISFMMSSHRHQPQTSDRRALDFRFVHSHLPMLHRAPVRQRIVVVLRQRMPGLPDRVLEAAVVGGREIDDLAVTRHEVLLVAPVGGDGADVDAAPVAAVRHRATDQRTKRRD